MVNLMKLEFETNGAIFTWLSKLNFLVNYCFDVV